MKNFERGLPIFELIDGFNNILFKNCEKILDIDISFGFNDVNKSIVKFLMNDVLTDYLYNSDRSHSVEHILTVSRSSLLLADKMNLDKNIILTAAIYHDLGRIYDKDFSKNYMISALGIVEDTPDILSNYFEHDELTLIVNTILELDPSIEKTNEYSKVLSDANTLFELSDIDYLIKRYSNYVVAHYTYETTEKMIDKIYKIICNRYKDKNSIGNIYYTNIAKKIYKKNIDNIKEIIKNKKVFISKLKELVDEEFEKQEEARG